MNAPRHDIDDARIDAFLDGELPAQERQQVEQAAASDPVLAERLRLDRALLRALAHRYSPILDEPVPVRLIRAVGPQPWPWWRRIAAAAGIAAIGAGLGWQASRWTEPDRLAAARPVSVEAVAAHAVYLPEVRHPVEVDSSQREHLDRWLSKRLAHELVSPELREFGFHLVGGRLLPDSGRPAAQYMYESTDGERITVYARGEPRAATTTPIRVVEDRGFRVAHWEADRMSYAVTGRLSQARMEQVASAVRDRI
jgi:anti-sigma factor RsiW